MLRVERKIWNWILKNPIILLVIAGTILSLLLRYWAREFKSGDMDIIVKWHREMAKNGGFKALSQQTGDYGIFFQFFLALSCYLPFSPLINSKLVLLPFDYIQAIAIGLIVKEITKSGFKGALAYVIAILFPVVLLNSAFWGQCESMISGFGLLAFYFLLKKKPILAFIALGLAFAFKLQAVFFIPFFLFYYVYKKEFSFLHLLLIPATFLVTALPGILMGRGVKEAFDIVLNQKDQYLRLSYNYPSFWGLMFPNMAEGFYDELDSMMIYLTLTTLAVGMILLFRLKKPLSDADLVKVMALMLYVSPLMLPNMHERYDYMAIMACLIIAFLDARTIPFLLIFLQINLRTYGDYLFGEYVHYEVNWVALSVANIACFTAYVWNCASGIRKRELGESTL